MMKTLKVLIAPLWLITFAAVACMKNDIDELPHPQMHYTNLNDLEIKANNVAHVDIDGNGSADFTFYTQLVGDPILQRDRLQFLAGSKQGTNLLMNEQNESPRLVKGNRIGLSHKDFTWYEVSSLVLAEKIMQLNGSTYWNGTWTNASHHFLPVQINKEGKVYNGWIEVSFNTTGQKLILHKTAISTENDKEVKAGC